MIPAAVEDHLLNALFLGAFGHQLTDGLSRRHIPALGSRALVHRGCRYERAALAVVNDLRVDVRHAAKHRQARTLRGARQLAADALVNPAADLLLFGSTNHFAPAPVLPTFLRNASPV